MWGGRPMRLVLSSDQHLTAYVPTCRVESKQEWLQFQYQRLREVVNIANMKDAHLVIGGDLFDHPREEDEVIALFLDAIHPLLNKCYIIGGNHSLPNHREANISSSSLGVLVSASLLNKDKLEYLVCNEELIDGRFEHSVQLNEDITIIHTCCFPTEDDIPFSAKATHAEALAQKYNTPWLLVGDLHQSYHMKIGDQNVLSSGCLTAQTVREKDAELGVYFIDTGNKIDVTTAADERPMYRVAKSEVEFIPIFHDKELVSTSHLKPKKQDTSLQSLVDILNDETLGAVLDYIRNLLYFVVNNKVSAEAEAIIEEIKEEQ